MDKIIKLMDAHPGMSLEDMATMLGSTAEQVAKELDTLRKEHIYMGEKAIINWDKIGEGNHVCAFIDVQVQPKLGKGFDEVASAMSQIPDVECCYLMSGGYDISIKMKGKSFQDIALFVARKLSAIEGVLSTRTHFVLKRYKDDGVIMDSLEKDDRGNISL
ncbi:MAG: Lrp/AsnC family transcriptional regulator [Clostridia bacterium]|nr:Lrp/AsnC family transcriptional regulator [Clostridia bacterium]